MMFESARRDKIPNINNSWSVNKHNVAIIIVSAVKNLRACNNLKALARGTSPNASAFEDEQRGSKADITCFRFNSVAIPGRSLQQIWKRVPTHLQYFIRRL